MERSRQIKAALFIIVCILLFIFGFNFLKGTSLFETQKTVYAFYTEVEGLSVGSNVTLNGLVIGKVMEIDFAEDQRSIKVEMKVRKDLRFSKKSKATLYEIGLIGGMAIAIDPEYSNAVFQSGDTLVSIKKPGLTELINKQITPLQEKLISMLSSADSIFVGVSNVLDTPTQENLKYALESLTTTIDNFGELSASLERTVSANEVAFNATMSNLSSSSQKVDQLMDSLNGLALNKTFSRFDKTVSRLNNVLKKIDEAEGTAGQLITDKELYENLARSTKEMEELLRDLKENPKRYVHFSLFGKKQKPYQPKNNQ